MTRAAVRPASPATLPAAPTVARVLQAAAVRLGAAGLATPRQDAEALLARALGTARLGLYTAGRAPVPSAGLATFETLLARRLRHEPVQYLLGEAEFCGLVLGVGPGVFIPRPETEALVGRALALGPRPAATVLDLCTGSGAIACALAAERPGWTVWAVDRAAPALACARANVDRLDLAGRVRVVEGDLFPPLAGCGWEGADLLVANPPYLDAPMLPDLPVEVRDWEPRDALDGGPDGLDVIRRLVREAPAWLRPGGAMLIEIGHAHGPAVGALAGGDPRYTGVRLHRDFRGQDRVLEVWRR
jgi:release factor glutamine methyltransferase